MGTIDEAESQEIGFVVRKLSGLSTVECTCGWSTVTIPTAEALPTARQHLADSASAQ